MKTVTSKETFDFLVKGIKGTSSEEMITISPKGVDVDETSAMEIKQRFGALVEIKEAKKAAAKSDAPKEDDSEEKESTEEAGKDTNK